MKLLIVIPFIGCGAHRHYPTNPQVHKNVYQAMEELMLISGANRRPGALRAGAQITLGTLDTVIPDYGCWCPKIYTGFGFGGIPVDDVDELCREWSQCRTCSALEQCTGELDVNYQPTIGIDSVNLNLVFQCNGMNECTTHRCECDLFYSQQLSQLVVAGAGDLDNMHRTDAHCGGGGGTPANPADACCGNAPHWESYSSAINQCVNGEILPLGASIGGDVTTAAPTTVEQTTAAPTTTEPVTTTEPLTTTAQPTTTAPPTTTPPVTTLTPACQGGLVCQNGGSCQVLATTAEECCCPMEFSGANCEINSVPAGFTKMSDTAMSSACTVTGGTTDFGGLTDCICPTGWTVFPGSCNDGSTLCLCIEACTA